MTKKFPSLLPGAVTHDFKKGSFSVSNKTRFWYIRLKSDYLVDFGNRQTDWIW